jgi:hypothetical protein
MKLMPFVAPWRFQSKNATCAPSFHQNQKENLVFKMQLCISPITLLALFLVSGNQGLRITHTSFLQS